MIASRERVSTSNQSDPPRPERKQDQVSAYRTLPIQRQADVPRAFTQPAADPRLWKLPRPAITEDVEALLRSDVDLCQRQSVLTTATARNATARQQPVAGGQVFIPIYLFI